jgi:hypothetical protein
MSTANINSTFILAVRDPSNVELLAEASRDMAHGYHRPGLPPKPWRLLDWSLQHDICSHPSTTRVL